MSDEFGPWIEHNGKGCPVVGQVVLIKLANSAEDVVVAGLECLDSGIDPSTHHLSAWVWTFPTPKHIVRYRVKKPRGMEILESLLVEQYEDA